MIIMDRMPVFVKIDEYNDVLDIVKAVRTKLENAKETLLKIHDLKNEEDHQLEMWQNTLTEVEKKVDFIDNSLSEPDQF